MRLLERVLGDEPPATVVLVHGPGGIGKSTLLREVCRRGTDLGYEVFWLDGRGSPPASVDVDELFGRTIAARRPLVLIDTYERISALGAYLREQALGELPDSARVVIAGREVPGWEWDSGPLGAVTMRIPLLPLSADDARDLLGRRGIRDEELVTHLTAWAEGEPLALSAAADAVTAGVSVETSRLTDDAALARTLITRLARDELAGANHDVLAVASIAHGVDVTMLESVLPGLDGELALEWLRGLSFSDDAGGRVTIHERLRRALRIELRSSSAGLEKEIRRRLADYLYERARRGEVHLIPELGDLIEDPRIRWGLGMESGAHAYADVVRPGDVERVAATIEDAPESWPRFSRWFREAPQHVYTIRDTAGELAGFGVWVTYDDAPDWASSDPIVGPRLEHAHTLSSPSRAVISGGGRPLRWGAQQTRAAIANPVMVGRRGIGVRYFYGAGYQGRAQQADFYKAIGYERIPELDSVEDGRVVECHLLDMGEEGVVGGIRDLVYRDLGLPVATPPQPEPELESLVREALRNYHDPDTLAASPLAVGASQDERCQSVRRVLDDAMRDSFGDSEGERLLRDTIEWGYINRAGSHETTARLLHLSRATYFRRLARATQRVAGTIASSG